MINLRSIVLLLALAISAPQLAFAADWPNRPIHFIVPFPAGGSTDVAARVVGDYLSRTLGQQVVVENKSGANGNIGIEYAVKSVPDGYTVLIATDAVSSNPHVYKMDFDPLKELIPVVELSHQPIALAAHPSLGVTTLGRIDSNGKAATRLALRHRKRRWFAPSHGRTCGMRSLPASHLNRCRIVAARQRSTI